VRHALRPPARAPRCALLGLLALLPLLAACAPFGPYGPTPPKRLDDAHQILRPLLIGENAGDLDTLDPALIQFGDDYNLAQAIFPPLVTTDAAQDVVPWAATALPDVSPDGLTYTFHLHSGMRWSDGVPIDAATYTYSINRSIDKCTSSGVWAYLNNIRGAVAFHKLACPQGARSQPLSLNLTTGPNPSVVVVDPLTLKITLESPAAYFLAELTWPISYAQPRQLIDTYGKRWTDHLADGGGFGGNLFKITTWDHRGRLSLARNDAFWGTKPALRAVDYTLYKDSAKLWSDYKASTGDVGAPISAADPAAKAMPGYQGIPQLVVRFLALNWTKPPFDDARARRAFDLAIDRAALCNQALNGTCFPTFHILVKGLLGHDEQLRDPAGRTGGAALTADVAEAQRLAGSYRDEKCAGDYAKCPPITLTIVPGSAVGRFLLGVWQAAFPGWKIMARDFPHCPQVGCDPLQLWNAAWGADYADPQDILSLQMRTGSDYNYGHISAREADALLDRADVELDQATRLSLYQRAEQLFVDQVAWIPYGQSVLRYVVRPNVAGWTAAAGWDYTNSMLVPLPAWQSAYLHD